MVHVKVEEQESETGLLIPELTPRTDTGKDGIPALIRTVGDLG